MKKQAKNRKKTETVTKKSKDGTKRGQSPSSKKNLKKGGPGRPKGLLNFKTRLELGLTNLADKFVEQHNKKPKNKNNQIKVEDVDIMGDIFEQYLNLARSGNLKAMDSILDRAYGKAIQTMNVGGQADNPIKLEHEMAEVEAEVEEWMDGWFNPTKKKKVVIKKKHANSKTDKGTE